MAEAQGNEVTIHYNQSPLTAMPATKNAPMRIICSTATKLNANHRNPFIRYTQNPANASESKPSKPYVVLAIEFGLVRKKPGPEEGYKTPMEITTGKNSSCVSASQCDRFHRGS